MTEYPYIRYDPTGNITVLVTVPVPKERRAQVASAVMRAIPCEQVGFLSVPPGSRARVRLDMMGGEFCGNASMCAAAWAAGDAEGETVIPAEVSGAEGILHCAVRRLSNGWEGRVPMPPVRRVSREGDYTRVDMDGITHYISRRAMTDAQALAAIAELARACPADAVGLLQWDGSFMKPLVHVPATGTTVWETGCGSGSAAVGAAEALEKGAKETPVRQPGGVIAVRCAAKGGAVTSVAITGTVKELDRGVLTL